MTPDDLAPARDNNGDDDDDDDNKTANMLPPPHHARGEVYNPFGPPLTLTYHFGSTVTLCQTLAQVLDSRTQRSRTFIMDLNRLDAMLSTQGNPPDAACAAPPSYISMCGLCGEAVAPSDRTWKATKDHFVCGRRFDLASKACCSDRGHKDAWTSFVKKDDDYDADSGESTRMSVRKQIAQNYGTPAMKADDLRKLLVTLHRERSVRATNKSILMDQYSFKAHMRFVRGWPKAAVALKWNEIEATPQSFRTKFERGILKIWVPQNPEVSVEDALRADVHDSGRELQLASADATNFLFSVGGGVVVSTNGAAVVGGPASLDDDFDSTVTMQGKAKNLEPLDLSDSESSSEVERMSGRADGSKVPIAVCPFPKAQPDDAASYRSDRSQPSSARRSPREKSAHGDPTDHCAAVLSEGLSPQRPAKKRRRSRSDALSHTSLKQSSRPNGPDQGKHVPLGPKDVGTAEQPTSVLDLSKFPEPMCAKPLQLLEFVATV